MKKTILLLLILYISFKVNADPAIDIELSSSIVEPKKTFGLHYSKGYSFGARIAIDFSSDNFLGYYISIPYTFNLINIKDSNKKAQINTIGVGIATYLFCFNWGYDFLLGFFKIDDATYNSFGKSTSTELKEKNGKIQIGIRRHIGLRLPIGEYFSASYKVESTSLDYKFNVWHSLSSGLLKQLTIQPFHVLTYVAFARWRLDMGTFLYLAGMGIAIAWYKNDYYNHNYNWDDPKPLNYTSHSLSFDFPIFFFWR